MTSFHADIVAGLVIRGGTDVEVLKVQLLGHTYPVAPTWVHRLVRAEVHLDAERIDFYTLRRRDPSAQPLLGIAPYAVPRKRFNE